MTITTETIGDVQYFTITNPSGSWVKLSSAGACVVSMCLSGEPPCEVVDYRPSKDAEIWSAKIEEDDSVVFMREDPDEDWSQSIVYRWTVDCTLEIYLSMATAGEVAPALINRTWFALNGRGEDLRDVTIWVNSDGYDQAQPLDAVKSVNNLKVRDWEQGLMNEIAVVASHLSHRQICVYSTYPLTDIDIKPTSIAVIPHDVATSEIDEAEDYEQLIFIEISRF